MPAKSGKQYRLMQAAAHGNLKKRGEKIGPSSDVAREFIAKTPAHKRSQWAKNRSDK